MNAPGLFLFISANVLPYQRTHTLPLTFHFYRLVMSFTSLFPNFSFSNGTLNKKFCSRGILYEAYHLSCL